MSPKSLVLIVLAVAVMAMGLYLFIQVRSSPAEASGERAASHEVTPPPVPAPAAPAVARPAPPPVHEPSPPDDDPLPPNIKVDAMMQLASKAYDKGDFDDAAAIAAKILVKEPSNVKMLRIMVSANCIQGDSVVAQQYYEKLPKLDRDQMKTRCDRYGVTFKEPAQ